MIANYVRENAPVSEQVQWQLPIVEDLFDRIEFALFEAGVETRPR